MNTMEELMARVDQVYRSIRESDANCNNYGVIESKVMAVDRVRSELQNALEHDMNDPYGNGPVWATARLALFNSIYR